MHELGIVFQIIKEVEEVANKNNVKAVKKVILEIGEVSTIVPKYLEDVWPWACKHNSTFMKDCALEIILLKAISYCNDCEELYDTLPSGKKCPRCNKDNTYLVSGNEANIKNIEVETK